jgi:hypothetical protein
MTELIWDGKYKDGKETGAGADSHLAKRVRKASSADPFETQSMRIAKRLERNGLRRALAEFVRKHLMMHYEP